MELIKLLAMPLVFIYFLPTWVALGNRHLNLPLVLILNLLTGWTIMGWFIILAFALWPARHDNYRQNWPVVRFS